jgi:phage gp16-like protein
MPAVDPPELQDAMWASLSKESERTKRKPLAERVAALEAFRAEKNREGWKPEHVAAEQARRPDNKYVTRNGGIAPRGANQ